MIRAPIRLCECVCVHFINHVYLKREPILLNHFFFLCFWLVDKRNSKWTGAIREMNGILVFFLERISVAIDSLVTMALRNIRNCVILCDVNHSRWTRWYWSKMFEFQIIEKCQLRVPKMHICEQFVVPASAAQNCTHVFNPSAFITFELLLLPLSSVCKLTLCTVHIAPKSHAPIHTDTHAQLNKIHFWQIKTPMRTDNR